MANLNGFDANTVSPMLEFEALPAGEYIAVIVASEEKDTKSGNGSFLELEFEVLDGEHKGRRLWTRLNLKNPSQNAVKIAQAELSTICRAVGKMTPNDSLELQGLPLQVKVQRKKREDTGGITNRITGYAKIKTLPDKPQESGGNTPPWKLS